MNIKQANKIQTTLPPKNLQKIPSNKQQIELGKLWNTLVNGIVRPPRAKYNQGILGLNTIPINQTVYFKSNPTVIHQEKYNIHLTIFEPQYKNNAVILYLHGNSSSKAESLSIIRFLPKGFSMAAFDFIGCGKNQQSDYITLGYRQSKQAQSIVKYLKNKCNYDQVIIWGRSMGAASALLYGQASIIVADSSFKSLRSLSKQVAKQIPYVPKWLVTCLFPCIFYKLKKDVQKKGQYDMDQCDVKQALKRINPQTTLIFMSGDDDKLIHHRNSQKLYDSFVGKHKYIQIFKGNHNSKRPEQVLKKVMDLVAQQYQRIKRQKISKTLQDRITPLEINLKASKNVSSDYQNSKNRLQKKDNQEYNNSKGKRSPSGLTYDQQLQVK